VSYLEAFDTAADETELLAALLRNPRRAGELTEAVEPADFGDPNHAELWITARRLCSEARTPDVRALHREIAAHGRRAVIEETLKRAMAAPGDTLDLAERLERIRDARRREALHAAGARLQQLAASPSCTVDEAYERALTTLTGTDAVGSAADEPVHIADAMARFTEAQRSVPADQIVRTPWPSLNVLLGGGMHRQRVYVVAGSTGSGKSNVGLSLAGHAAFKGVPSVVFSAEMSEFEVTGRWFARTAGVDLADVTAYRLSEDATAAAHELAETSEPLYLVDRPNITAAAVYATTRRLLRRTGVRLVVVDYLQLLEAEDRRVARYEQVGAISRRLKLLSRELDVAVVVLAQLNRAPSTRADRRPRKEDLRESGQIEQDSDAVILLYHHEENVNGSAVPTYEVELIVDKNRHHRTGSVCLEWEPEHATLR
jgi:replicative DNA helicase